MQNPDEKPEYMTKYIDRNWAKWENNLAPMLAAADKAEQNANRRKTLKMNDDDWTEIEKSGEEKKMPFSTASEIVGRVPAAFAAVKSVAEEMFEKIETPYHDEDR